MSERYDAIVIGSGAGGGTLVHRLAPSGKRILLLECGGWGPMTGEPQTPAPRPDGTPAHGAAPTTPQRRRVVIVGGDFGGLGPRHT